MATEFTPPEMVQEKVLTEIHSILYWLDKNNPSGGKPTNTENDSQFRMWEIPVRRWSNLPTLKTKPSSDLPKEKDDVHKPEYAPVLKIDSPQENQTYASTSDITIKFSSQGKYELGKADLFFNNNYLGSLGTKSRIFSPSSQNRHRLSVLGTRR